MVTPPGWFADIPLVEWSGDFKDLSFVGGAHVDRIVLVDDMPDVVHPAQRAQHVAIAGFAPPFTFPDGELPRVESVLRAMCEMPR